MATDQPAAPKKRLANMSAGEKLVFLAKFVVFLCTLGFAYTHVLDD